MDDNEVKSGSFIHGERKRCIPDMRTTISLKYEDAGAFQNEAGRKCQKK